jgi:hypothetical protein
VSGNVVLEHKAVVPMNRDDRLVRVDVVDVDGDDGHLWKNASPASVAVIRQYRDIVEVSIIDVPEERKCVRVDKKRVRVELKSVSVSRDDNREDIDGDRRRRNRVSADIDDVSADEDAHLADMIVVEHDRDDVDVDMNVVDLLLNVDQVDMDVVDVDRDGVDEFETGVSRDGNIAFVASDATLWSRNAVPSHRDVVDGFMDALDVDIDAN